MSIGFKTVYALSLVMAFANGCVAAAEAGDEATDGQTEDLVQLRPPAPLPKTGTLALLQQELDTAAALQAQRAQEIWAGDGIVSCQEEENLAGSICLTNEQYDELQCHITFTVLYQPCISSTCYPDASALCQQANTSCITSANNACVRPGTGQTDSACLSMFNGACASDLANCLFNAALDCATGTTLCESNATNYLGSCVNRASANYSACMAVIPICV